jgi:hypothetical protein
MPWRVTFPAGPYYLGKEVAKVLGRRLSHPIFARTGERPKA